MLANIIKLQFIYIALFVLDLQKWKYIKLFGSYEWSKCSAESLTIYELTFHFDGPFNTFCQ